MDTQNESETPTVEEDRESALRTALLDAQFEFAEDKSQALLVLINGPDGSGKGEVTNRLNEWLDPRGVSTLAYDIGKHKKYHGPLARRYWLDMPERGRIAIVLGSWYHQLLYNRITDKTDLKQFEASLEMTRHVEAMLKAEGVRVLKIWLKLSAGKAQKRYEEKSNAPGSFRKPLMVEWDKLQDKKEQKRLVEAAEELSGMSGEPWHEICAIDTEARDFEVGELVLQALTVAPVKTPAETWDHANRIAPGKPVLPALDLTQSLKKDEYKKRLKDAQNELYKLTRSPEMTERGMVLVFEGNDAAGKGGAIRRARAALDPVQSTVVPIAAPSQEALSRPYLWRFWRRIPDQGDITIFDRSWYGRVLVERVEGFAAPHDWARAYEEINDFETQLIRAGYIVHKFWLAIDADEQLARFKARENTPHKRFKITDDDWRNREKWDLYASAVEDMVALCSKPQAPWTIVEANDKRFSRVKVLETLVDRLKTELS
ncbi:polyphosphate:AMP phosphotransferase [Amaricoccus tamworthensis]|uniref:polyphosphate:AMP phosphotransferase n=1 Tax=Amaricoccus tamworthensis TaxID=57002 RepID=UPI003C7A56F6